MAQIEQVIKVVFTVQRPGTTTAAIQNWLASTVEPYLRAVAEERLGTDLTGLTLSFRHQVVPFGVNIWQVYPRMVVSGVSVLTNAQILAGWRRVRDGLVERLTTQAQALGAQVLAVYAKEYNA